MGRTWLEDKRKNQENETVGAAEREKRSRKRKCAAAALMLCAGLSLAGCSGKTEGGNAGTGSRAEENTAGESQKPQAGQEQKAQADKSQGEGTADQAAAENASALGSGSGQNGASEAGNGEEANPADDFQVGMPVREGVTAPDFTAELIDGSSVTLSELQGKPVLINFWATWCGPCVREMPAFERLKEDFGDQIEILAVNSGDDAETVKDFAEKNGYTFPIALDETYEISMLYPSTSIPYTVIVDAEGKVSHVSAGAADADTMYDVYKEALGL